MSPGHYYSESDHPVYGNFDGHCLHPPTAGFHNELYGFEHTDHADSTATSLSAWHTVAHDSDGFPQMLPIIHSENPFLSTASQSNAMLLSTEARGIYPVQPRATYPFYIEKATQTVNLDTSSESEGNHLQEEHQMNQQPVTLKMVPQVIYRPTRHPTNFVKSKIIKFVVNGKEGICLSNASEGDWVGFEGGDDRSLFEGDRLQIMIRLHLVGCSPWHSKIPITDFTKKRRPITKKKLTAEVAKSVKKFIAREKLNGHDGSHPQYLCDWGDVSLENVFLTRMVRVSAASWQPEIFVERSSASQVASSLPQNLLS